jgi:hypothetical protein
MAMLLFVPWLMSFFPNNCTANELSEPAHKPSHLFIYPAFLVVDLGGSQLRTIGSAELVSSFFVHDVSKSR